MFIYGIIFDKKKEIAYTHDHFTYTAELASHQ